VAQQGQRSIAIIGCGFSGLCLAMQLRRAGHDAFTIYEQAERLGGTWRDNTYPGAACDSPSFAYCFSFEQKTDWSRKWSPQPEILAYMEHCARKYDLLPHIRFGTGIAAARWDEEAGLWRLTTTGGETATANVLVSGVGQLNRPSVPDIPGLDDFRGTWFHSARWDPDFDASGKRVGVVGNAASAVQFVPELAKETSRLTIFQRSANWMLPKFDHVYTDEEKRRFARRPWLARLYRWWIWASFEMRFPIFLRNRFLSRRLEALATRAMRGQISDPELQEKLVPDYPIGGKRILISDDYYPTLDRDDVEVVTAGIERVTPGGVRTRDGRDFPLDALVLATGFQTTDFLVPMEITGRDGRKLHDEWKDGARAYLGISTPGFPNLFMMYGPNTNLGHNSILFMLECQTRYIQDCLRQMDQEGLASIELREDVMDAFTAKLRRELERTAWAATEHSWYKNEAGLITNNWSGTTLRYWWNTRRADLGLYRQVAARPAVHELRGAPAESAEPSARSA